MTETEILLDTINPLDLYGANNSNLLLMEEAFPTIKIIARGDILKLRGSKNDILLFENRLESIITHLENRGNINQVELLNILAANKESNGDDTSIKGSDIILFGNGGNVIKARTANQKKLMLAYQKHDMVFAVGPAGSGKTYTAVALAVRSLRNHEVKRIILTRPAVEAGENLGFLPGDLKEKLDPYLRPLYDALRDMIPAQKLAEYMENGTIEIAPLAFMRGRTLDHSVVILDEAQNTTPGQLKMFLTRMGVTSKFIVTGDVTQIDLPRNQSSGLKNAIDILQDIKDIGFIFLNEKDIIRHKLVTKIINAYKD